MDVIYVIITLDRVLTLTKGQILKNYITMKILYWITAVCLLLFLVVAILLRVRDELFEGYMQVIVFIVLFIKLPFVLVTTTA